MIATAGGAFAQTVRGLGGLPLYFVAQPARDGRPQFLASSRDTGVLISPGLVQFNRRNQPAILAQLLGSDSRAFIHGDSELAGKINYLQGNGSVPWRTSVPTYDRVRVDNLYPGISAVYHGNQDRLEYDYQIAPGASPAAIQLRISGADKIAVNAAGELELFAGAGEIRQPKPGIYQTVAGVRRDIVGGYRLVDDRTVAFSIGDYDHSQPLVIDPVLYYSSYFGGTSSDSAFAVAVNTNDGSFFVAGQTLSSTIAAGAPFATTNAFQTKFQGGSAAGDAFVAKFDKNYNLVYLTYLGGSADDYAAAIAVDGAGHAFVGGYTDSLNFPVTNRIPGRVGVPGLAPHLSGAYDPNLDNYPADGFVAELETNGSSLIFSTYLGGNAEDGVLALALDDVDNVYVTGYTLSTNFPCTNAIPFKLAGGYPNQYLNFLACPYSYFNYNAFVAEIASQGAGLLFSSYLGGTNLDAGTGIAVDGLRNIYVTGYTGSTNFPNTNAFQACLNQNTNIQSAQSSITVNVFDAFVAKIAPGPANYHLLYSSYLGSTNYEAAAGIAVDATGAYVTGYSCSSNYYNTRAGVIYTGITNNLNGGSYITNAFVTKIVTTNTTPSLVNTSSIAWSVVFGGQNKDVGSGVALDPKGDVFVVGYALSGLFPATNGFGLLTTNKQSPGNEVFVTAFGPNCTNVLYSVLLGVNNNNWGYGIAVDQNSTAYIVGQSRSGNFPVTPAATNVPSLIIHPPWATALSGVSDGIVASIGLNSPSPIVPLSISSDITSITNRIDGTNRITQVWPPNINLTWPPNYLLTEFTNNSVLNYQWVPYNTNYVLEFAANLVAPRLTVTNGTGTNQIVVTEPGTNWFRVTNSASFTNGEFRVALPGTNQYEFFRLYNTNSTY